MIDRARFRKRAVRLAGAVAGATLTIFLAGARPPSVSVDQAWTNPQYDGRAVRVVAILPAVTFDGNRTASFYMAERWRESFAEQGYYWVPAAVVRERLGSTLKQRDSVLQAVARQVQDSGRPDPATSAWIASRLGAQAVLALRLDRWELQVGARDMGYVDLSASLVDSVGNLLWKSAGRARAEKERSVPSPNLPEPSKGAATREISQPRGNSSGSGSGSSQSAASSPGTGETSSGGGSSGGSSSQSRSQPAKVVVEEFDKNSPNARDIVPDLGPGEPVPGGIQNAVASLLGALGPRLPRGAYVRPAKP
jgi:uncharacterized membrane protein YgcG